MFETGPFFTCPFCGTDKSFGVLSIGGNRVHRRCKVCGNAQHEPLPELNKKVVYLDQFAFSELFKLEAGLRPQQAPLAEFWEEVSQTMKQALHLQQAIFPTSDIHSSETLVARHHAEIREAMNRLGGDATFLDCRDVEMAQTFECFDAFQRGAEPTFDLGVDRVMKSRRNVWLPNMRIVLDFDYSIFAEDYQKIVQQSADDLADIFEQWKVEKPAFDNVLNAELNSYADAKFNTLLSQTLKATSLLDSDHISEWLNAAAHPVVREFSTLKQEFENKGLSEEQAPDRVYEFWKWQGNLEQPYHRVGAYLFAALARKFAAGQKKLPTRGFMNDVKAISAYAPYVDAMFLDRECAALLSEEPLRSELNLRARIFSLSNGNEFIDYLSDIVQNTPPNVKTAASSVYGNI